MQRNQTTSSGSKQMELAPWSDILQYVLLCNVQKVRKDSTHKHPWVSLIRVADGFLFTTFNAVWYLRIANNTVNGRVQGHFYFSGQDVHRNTFFIKITSFSWGLKARVSELCLSCRTYTSLIFTSPFLNRPIQVLTSIDPLVSLWALECIYGGVTFLD